MQTKHKEWGWPLMITGLRENHPNRPDKTRNTADDKFQLTGICQKTPAFNGAHISWHAVVLYAYFDFACFDVVLHVHGFNFYLILYLISFMFRCLTLSFFCFFLLHLVGEFSPIFSLIVRVSADYWVTLEVGDYWKLGCV